MEHQFIYDNPFVLESNERLENLILAYTTYGKLNKKKDNTVWICHALTANSDPAQWWPSLLGSEKLFDPERHFIVCANIIGSCYGSTGPLSVNSKSKRPYYHSFPFITIRDIVSSFELLRNHLGIEKIHTVTGGSMGGMQALEWSIMNPDLFEHMILIGTNAVNSAWGIAFHESQRMAIEADVTWQKNHPKAGINGMKVARSIGLLSYRNYHTYKATQSDHDNRIRNFSASSYQRYQGEKLADRFNAFSYYFLCNTIDSHNVGRGRGDVEAALQRIKAKTCCIAIDSDHLFPIEESRFLTNHIPAAHYYEISSSYGHDGFLTEYEQLSDYINKFYKLR